METRLPHTTEYALLVQAGVPGGYSRGIIAGSFLVMHSTAHRALVVTLLFHAVQDAHSLSIGLVLELVWTRTSPNDAGHSSSHW